MRTYDDTFSGQRIYPGKVCLPLTLLAGHLDWEEKEMRLGRCEEEDMSDVQQRDPRNALGHGCFAGLGVSQKDT